MSNGGKVGYKKPPQEGQFKKGQSGNPRGRTSGSKNMKAVFEELLQKPIPIRQGDRQTSIPMTQALLMALMKKAVQGDIKAVELVLKTAEKCQLLLPTTVKAEPAPITWTQEHEAMKPFIEQLIKGGKPILPEWTEVKDSGHGEGQDKGEADKS